jgi:hypothetical protein
MKLLIRIGCLAAVIYLQSCGGSAIKNKTADSGQPGTAAAKIPVPDATDNLIVKDVKDLPGYWVGAFEADTLYDSPEYDSKINISIDAIDGNTVNGHCIIAGLFRPFTGTMAKVGATYRFTAQQTAYGKYDGVYKFSITDGDSTATGTWRANAKIQVRNRHYSLTKKLFHYNAYQKLEYGRFVDYGKSKKFKDTDEEDGAYEATAYLMSSSDVDKYNASVDLLTKGEVANLKKSDITVMRNSVFARHGYSFKKEKLRMYFEQQDWYIPISNDVRDQLTAVEKKNVDLLMRYEKNAKEYYDTFGR